MLIIGDDKEIHSQHHHLRQKTFTIGITSPSLSTTISPLPPTSNGLLRSSPNHRTILWEPTNTASSSTRSPLKNFEAPSTIVSASNLRPTEHSTIPMRGDQLPPLPNCKQQETHKHSLILSKLFQRGAKYNVTSILSITQIIVIRNIGFR